MQVPPPPPQLCEQLSAKLTELMPPTGRITSRPNHPFFAWYSISKNTYSLDHTIAGKPISAVSIVTVGAQNQF
jgi:hypothetical protein